MIFASQKINMLSLELQQAHVLIVSDSAKSVQHSPLITT